VANDAAFVNHKRNAVGKETGEIEDTVSFGHLLFGVGKQRKRGAGFLGELAVPVWGVEADPQHLRARSFEPGDITLIRLDLFRSTGRRGANIKSQDNGFLAPEVRELDEFAVLVRQGKVRSAVANLQSRGRGKQWHKDDTQPGNQCEFSGHEHKEGPLVTCHCFLRPLVTGHSSWVLPVLQKAALRVGVVGIQCLALAVNVLDHPFFIDDKGGAMRHGELVVQDAVFRRNLAREITQEGEGHTDLLGVSLVGKLAVHADPQHLGSCLLEFGDISLIRLQLLRSTSGEGEHVKRQHHVLLPQKLIERNLVAVLIG